jgi:hypothetical protein
MYFNIPRLVANEREILYAHWKNAGPNPYRKERNIRGIID